MPRGKPFKPNKKAEKIICDLYLNNKSCAEIGMKYGVKAEAIRRVLNRNLDREIIWKVRSQTLSVKAKAIFLDEDEVARLWLKGKSYKQIAEKFNISIAPISKIIRSKFAVEEIRNQGIKKQAQNCTKIKPESENVIVENYSSGNYSFVDLAVIFGCSYNAIGRVLRKYFSKDEIAAHKQDILIKKQNAPDFVQRRSLIASDIHKDNPHIAKMISQKAKKRWASPNFKEEMKVVFSAAKQGIDIDDWKGFKTPENVRIRSSKEYADWRLSVFKRDNFTCQICDDAKGGNLQAHHLSFFASDIEKRFDINNGVTLCEECHRKIH